MIQQVRVCRDCGEEYRPEAVRCADCGGELEDRLLDEDGNPIEPEGTEAPPAPVPVNSRVLFVTSQAAEIVPLAEALREAPIEFHLAERPATPEGGAARYALLVREEDAAAAERVLGSLITTEEAEEEQAADSHFVPGQGYTECPACGASQPQGAVECSECGLTLGATEAEGAPGAAPEGGAPVCARCSAPLPEPGARCPACGSSPIG